MFDARHARVDRDVYDRCRASGSTSLLDELLEEVSYLAGSFGFLSLDVIRAREHDDHSWIMWEDDPVCPVDRVKETRASEASFDDGERSHVFVEAVPAADA